MVSVVCYELVGNSGIQIQLHGKPVSIALQYFPSLEVETVHMQPSAVNSQTHRFGHRHGFIIRLETFKKKWCRTADAYPACQWAIWPSPPAWAPAWPHAAPPTTGHTGRHLWGRGRAAALMGCEGSWGSVRGRQTSPQTTPGNKESHM